MRSILLRQLAAAVAAQLPLVLLLQQRRMALALHDVPPAPVAQERRGMGPASECVWLAAAAQQPLVLRSGLQLGP